MIRDYLQVTPTSANLDPDTISTSIKSLYKLSDRGAGGLLDRMNPCASGDPLTFEFIAMSKGRDEPVEFYYGADGRLDVLKQRLRTIYPSSFDVDRVQVDLIGKLIDPNEFRTKEVSERLKQGGFTDLETTSPVTNRDGPIEVDGGARKTRSSLDDVSPYGVRWRGRVERRKDWMTTLTDFSEIITASANHPASDDSKSGRAPLAPLIEQLTEAPLPMVFQVLFQRKPDWSRQARRRAGALLAGTDTLLQKVLSIESPGLRRGPRRKEATVVSNSLVDQSRMWDRERVQKTETRLDQLRNNSPKRTFKANVRLLALASIKDGLITMTQPLEVN